MRLVSIVVLSLAAVACEDASPAGSVSPAECASDAECAGQCVAGVCVLDGDDAGDDANAEPDTGLPDAQPPDMGSEGGGVGDPCDDGADCRSGYCVEVAEANGQQVCTDFCDPNGDTCPEGWVCSAVVNNEADRVFLCFPERDFLCSACDSDSDCGGLSDRCLTLTDGAFCGRDCSQRSCPEHFDCLEVEDGEFQCSPAALVCSACLDEDQDGYGLGVECLGADCNEEDRAVNAGADELCNGIDDNCDGGVDEGFDLAGDPDHCGGCHQACNLPFATAICVDGLCGVGACQEGRGDCNRRPDDGCETDLTTPESCGTCDELGGQPGTACGTCDRGIWTCTDMGTVTCEGDPGMGGLNECMGCRELDGAVGDACGTCGLGWLACAGPDDLACADDPGEDAENSCGGCGELEVAPRTPCGVCDSGEFACQGPEVTACVGDVGEEALNGCGGCMALNPAPQTACGRCGLDIYVCDGEEGTVCDGDTAVNGCGGCQELPQPLGSNCGVCGVGEYVCDGENEVRCDDPPPPAETCNLFDDNCNGQIDEGLNCTINVHRSRHGDNGNHFYTTNRAEAACCGFVVESFDYFGLYRAAAPGVVPFYRCQANGRHLYTTSATCEALGGGALEGRIGYIATRELPGTVELYRGYRGNNDDHFYTTSLTEFNAAIQNGGYRGEPSAGWVFPP